MYLLNMCGFVKKKELKLSAKSAANDDKNTFISLEI